MPTPIHKLQSAIKHNKITEVKEQLSASPELYDQLDKYERPLAHFSLQHLELLEYLCSPPFNYEPYLNYPYGDEAIGRKLTLLETVFDNKSYDSSVVEFLIRKGARLRPEIFPVVYAQKGLSTKLRILLEETHKEVPKVKTSNASTDTLSDGETIKSTYETTPFTKDLLGTTPSAADIGKVLDK